MKLPETLETDLAHILTERMSLAQGVVQTGGASEWPEQEANPAPRVSLAVEYEQKADLNSVYARVLLVCSLEYEDGYTNRGQLVDFAARVATTLADYAPLLPSVITASLDAAPALSFDSVHETTSQTVLLKIYDNQPIN